MREEKMSLSEVLIQYAKKCGCTVEQEPSGQIKLATTYDSRPEDFRKILQHLSDNPSVPISSIDMSARDTIANDYSLEDIGHLAHFLRHTPTLRNLNLEHTWLSESELALVIDALEENTSLQDLNMENTCFGPQMGEKFLALVQTKNTTLRKFAVESRANGEYKGNCPGAPRISTELANKIQHQLSLNALEAQNALYGEEIRGNYPSIQAASPDPAPHLYYDNVEMQLAIIRFLSIVSLHLPPLVTPLASSASNTQNREAGSAAGEETDEAIYEMDPPISIHIAAALLSNPALHHQPAPVVLTTQEHDVTVSSVLNTAWSGQNQNAHSSILTVPSSSAHAREDLEKAWGESFPHPMDRELTPDEMVSYGYVETSTVTEEKSDASPLRSVTHSLHANFFSEQQSARIPTSQDASLDTSTLQEDNLQQAWKAVRARAHLVRDTRDSVVTPATENVTTQHTLEPSAHILRCRL